MPKRPVDDDARSVKSAISSASTGNIPGLLARTGSSHSLHGNGKHGNDSDSDDDPSAQAYFEFKEYLPDVEDLIDRAVADRLNEIRPDNLVVQKVKPGCYQIGDGPYTYLRLVRNLLMARVGGGWMGFKMFLLRKMSLRRRATVDQMVVEDDPTLT
jgi:hypothetical protein